MISCLLITGQAKAASTNLPVGSTRLGAEFDVCSCLTVCEFHEFIRVLSCFVLILSEIRLSVKQLLSCIRIGSIDGV